MVTFADHNLYFAAQLVQTSDANANCFLVIDAFFVVVADSIWLLDSITECKDGSP
jgi:hypothetical protein